MLQRHVDHAKPSSSPEIEFSEPLQVAIARLQSVTLALTISHGCVEREVKLGLHSRNTVAAESVARVAGELIWALAMSSPRWLAASPLLLPPSLGVQDPRPKPAHLAHHRSERAPPEQVQQCCPGVAVVCCRLGSAAPAEQLVGGVEQANNVN
ncbi:hypothetical protein K458DRAFT_394935 [Lentithecium fluviatile CBS 122367]|uniref:Uncharacterized protein n=1 Tax=Lentithecium fluviatile CBS 122367 TaxID=1168545 RepID=A0A6G1IK78_9PLEO|nr:hypothetical protein K458DRAFT_394935 [Lentithecium fluviatile CBS 122367]